MEFHNSPFGLPAWGGIWLHGIWHEMTLWPCLVSRWIFLPSAILEPSDDRLSRKLRFVLISPLRLHTHCCRAFQCQPSEALLQWKELEDKFLRHTSAVVMLWIWEASPHKDNKSPWLSVAEYFHDHESSGYHRSMDARAPYIKSSNTGIQWTHILLPALSSLDGS